ncbi:hypothetical protein LCGC14_0622090 [marine sediment metagenome]|uniref:Uncharacterized protein n=1 Tax=marine sediment metagenome TaxID=412755 RepID=A0A0F9RNW3_9ZZZZ
MAPAAILIAGSLKAASQIQEGRIAKAQGSFAKKIALRNQESLNRQAKAEEAASRLEERRIARKQKIFQARQLARIGKGGTGLAGATLAALVDTATQFSISRNLALRRGVFRAGALRERGVIIAAQGRWAKTLGKQAQRLSYLKAGASLLGAAGAASITSSPGAGFTNPQAMNTAPAFTTGQRFSTFSGGGTVLPR